ncbi:sulfate reduction electron transfer complex DsrMKJOP subunit DsrJ [bacterium]|nr:sulfate reduction electron transfer complex DsrMKJOP subunit DsrJ [bacterium]MBU1651308.1 sulfate reduction electron transfer complex DsrMKJOP subunit DsrJ [bacterium]MBU1881061.1 sulfate reduction electron transfer complex DsrMKJOP subunit DsrJ [bacterium]
MNDKGKIVLGLIVFLVIMTFPMWYNFINGVVPFEDAVVQTANTPGKDKCVRAADYMRTQHMDLLNEWRQEVVRNGDRYTEDAYGNKIEKSLSNTCMDCHSNKEEFCDRCHNYMAVAPYCWDCHVLPAEVQQADMALKVDATEGNE